MKTKLVLILWMILFISFISFISFGSFAFADEYANSNCRSESAYAQSCYGSSLENTGIDSKNLQFTKLDAMEERQGCCSWHGGVCGCDELSGRLICCDGTLSPSCTCR
jgi:hypothetical protein